MNKTDKDALKSGAYTALWTFIALFAIAVAGFLGQLGEWAQKGGVDPFPHVSTLGYAFVSAVVAGLSGLVGTVVRLAQGRNYLPGNPPKYPTQGPGAN